jgi:hypothetical protein
MTLKAPLLLLLIMVTGHVSAQSLHSSIAICYQPPANQKLVGFNIKLSVPNDMSVNVSQDVDYEVYRILFGSGNNGFQLSGFSGLNVGNGEVTRFYLDGSRKFTRRYWRHDKRHGVDARGTLKNGRFWRYFGMFGETLSYYNVPADAAAYFDRILDSACFLN